MAATAACHPGPRPGNLEQAPHGRCTVSARGSKCAQKRLHSAFRELKERFSANPLRASPKKQGAAHSEQGCKQGLRGTLNSKLHRVKKQT